MQSRETHLLVAAKLHVPEFLKRVPLARAVSRIPGDESLPRDVHEYLQEVTMQDTAIGAWQPGPVHVGLAAIMHKRKVHMQQ